MDLFNFFCYRQNHSSTPSGQQNAFNFNSSTIKSISERLSDFSFNNNAKTGAKSLDGGDSSPSSSLASADSGTESPELGSGSADSGSGFSPGFELDGSTAPVDMLTGLFTRLSPTSFRRHNSMLIDNKNARLSFSSSSTILDINQVTF